VFILEEPYISEFLRQTVIDSNLPVLDTPAARVALNGSGVDFMDSEQFAETYRATPGARIYANSENAIAWIAENLADTPLPDAIDSFKNKVRFRELLTDLYPDYRFAALHLSELAGFDPTTLRAPFVVKPAVGFFSMGVHVVDSHDSWPEVVAHIEREVEAFARIYPDQVLGLDRFIAEEVIEGEEFAVDAYFDASGDPVVLNVLGHLFASAQDVSDRVYYTSAELVDRWREPFSAFLKEVGGRAGLRDFPVHAEFRVAPDGSIAAIEINPMRFAGWCVTDIANAGYGLNPYTAFLESRSPDWDAIARDTADRVFAVVIADLPSTLDRSRIASVDYEAFVARFTKPLELRRVDYTRYPVFAFVFAEVPAGKLGELHDVLGADLTPYLEMR